MITRLSQISAKIEINEYITQWSDISSHLEQLVEWPIIEVKLVNDGGSSTIMYNIIRFLKDHDIEVWR